MRGNFFPFFWSPSFRLYLPPFGETFYCVFFPLWGTWGKKKLNACMVLLPSGEFGKLSRPNGLRYDQGV